MMPSKILHYTIPGLEYDNLWTVLTTQWESNLGCSDDNSTSLV